MNKKAVWAICSGVLFTFSGCQKIWDYFDDHHNHAAKCRIEEIQFTTEMEDGGSQAGHAVFSYDNNDNPTQIQIYDPGNDSWPGDKGFRCDSDNRLIVYVEDMFISVWHKYIYVNATTIIDSSFVYSSGDYTVTDRPDTHVYTRVSKITLDNRGRIIRDENDMDGTKEYNYDFRGNLIRPGVTYTGKTNIRQTNRVWQFIDRDYSKNQPAGEVETFNSNNLPYQFSNEFSMSGGFNVLPIHPGAVVRYRCE